MDASVAPRPDSFVDLFDVIPLPDGGCVGCLRDRCSTQINSCFNSPVCQAGLFCTLQTCLASAGADAGLGPASFGCLLGCFNGDQAAAFSAIGVLTCLAMTCAPSCLPGDGGSLDATNGSDADGRAPDPDDGQAPDSGSDPDGPEPDVGADAADEPNPDVGTEPDTAEPDATSERDMGDDADSSAEDARAE